MRRVHTLAVVIGVAAAASLGCADDDPSGLNDAAMSAGPCPATQPAGDSACAQPDLVCEYGDHPKRSCRAYARCQAGVWTIQQQQCAPPAAAATCPANLAAASGSACDQKGAFCTFSDGAVCECTECRTGPVGPSCMERPVWLCQSTSPSCPASMPRAGASCGGAQHCDYGCDFGARRCTAGTWTPEYAICPMSRAARKENIRYVTRDDIELLAAQVAQIRLARYRYRNASDGAGDRLGFIIDDAPELPAVSVDGAHVDLYGLASMLVAANQAQARRIEALEKKVERLTTQLKRPSPRADTGGTKAASP